VPLRARFPSPKFTRGSPKPTVSKTPTRGARSRPSPRGDRRRVDSSAGRVGGAESGSWYSRIQVMLIQTKVPLGHLRGLEQYLPHGMTKCKHPGLCSAVSATPRSMAGRGTGDVTQTRSNAHKCASRRPARHPRTPTVPGNERTPKIRTLRPLGTLSGPRDGVHRRNREHEVEGTAVATASGAAAAETAAMRATVAAVAAVTMSGASPAHRKRKHESASV
jgi:hypothetical protein